MGNTIHLITIILCILSTNVQAQDKKDQIIGVWDTGEAKMEIHKEGNAYLGNPINSKGELNDQIEVLNLTYKDGKWVGKICSKKRGKLLDVECQVKGDTLILEVSTRLRIVGLEWARVES